MGDNQSKPSCMGQVIRTDVLNDAPRVDRAAHMDHLLCIGRRGRRATRPVRFSSVSEAAGDARVEAPKAVRKAPYRGPLVRAVARRWSESDDSAARSLEVSALRSAPLCRTAGTSIPMCPCAQTARIAAALAESHRALRLRQMSRVPAA